MEKSKSKRQSQHSGGVQAHGLMNVKSRSSERNAQQLPLPVSLSTISTDGTGSAEEQAKAMLKRATLGSSPPNTYFDPRRPAPSYTMTRGSDPFLALRGKSTPRATTSAPEQESRPRRGRHGSSLSEKEPMPPSPFQKEEAIASYHATPKADGPRQLYTDSVQFSSDVARDNASNYSRRTNGRDGPTARDFLSASSLGLYGTSVRDPISPNMPIDPQQREHDKHIEILAGKDWARLSSLSEDDRDYVTRLAGQRLRRNFDNMRRTRWQAHQEYVQEIPMFSLYHLYNGNPPMQPEAMGILEDRLARAQNDLQQGWDDDWRECCTEWKEILDVVAAGFETDSD